MTISLLVGSLGNWMAWERFGEMSERAARSLQYLEGEQFEILHAPGGQGFAAGRNDLIARAAGDIVAFLEAGCAVSPGWLRELADAFADPEVGAVSADCRDSLGRRIDETQGYVELAAGAFRRSALQRIGAYDESIEDAVWAQKELCRRLASGGWRFARCARSWVQQMLPRRESVPMAQGWRVWLQSARSVAGDETVTGGLHDPAWLTAAGGGVNPAHREAWESETREEMKRTPRASHIVFPAEEPRKLRKAPETSGPRLCLLSREYPPDVAGGIARMTEELAAGLAQIGKRVHVITQSRDGEPTVRWEEGVWVHRIGVAPREAPEGLPAEVWRYSAAAAEELRRIGLDGPIGIVDAPVWEGEAMAAIRDNRYCVVTNLETPLRVQREFGGPAADDTGVAAEEYVLRGCHAIRAISAAVRETIAERYGLPMVRKAVVIPPGLRDAAWAPEAEAGDGDVEVLFAGRFERRKGIDILLAAIPALCRRFSGLRFTLAGPDREPVERAGRRRTEVYREQFQRMGIGERVRFAGAVSDDELQRLYARCSLFTAPSLYESFGMVLLEAMRAARPVVACRTGGMVEVVEEGVTGLLAEPGNAASLEQALAALIGDAERRRRMGLAGRERFEQRYTAGKAAARSWEFYERLMRSPLAEDAPGAGG